FPLPPGRTAMPSLLRRAGLRALVALGSLLLPAALPGLALHAQEHGATPEAIALRADRMLDVRTGEVVRDVTVLVEGATIRAVNPGSLPAGTAVLELGDVTLLPGFIDMHTHLAYDIGPDWVARIVTRETEGDGAIRALLNARRTLDAGFTTVRDVGGAAVIPLARAVERGAVPGPHIFSARSSLSITGGHCDLTTGFSPNVSPEREDNGVANGPWEVVEAVRHQIKHGAKVIKVCATAGVLSLEGPVGAQQYTAEELRAAVEEAARHGVRVAAHAHGAQGILAAVEAGVTSIEHGSQLTDEILAAMKARGTWLVPTSYLADRIDLTGQPQLIRDKAADILPQARASLRRAVAAGVPIAFGTDAGVFPHGENAGEFAVYVAAGMTPLAALQTATVNAARALEVEDRGEIRPGLLADLVAVPGDPLQDITVTEDVRFVMVGGRVVKHPPAGAGR
ncbi:MAG: amidohydrolase family protein, partial [Longimicrobiales bacterium]|nr:amidohydrolase family protein [Longimicrobiales bacterium]